MPKCRTLISSGEIDPNKEETSRAVAAVEKNTRSVVLPSAVAPHQTHDQQREPCKGPALSLTQRSDVTAFCQFHSINNYK
jgi:hypothetical protein